MTQITVNPQEFGLESSEIAANVKAQFLPMLEKMEELEKEYNEVIQLDPMDDATEKAAHTLLQKYVKVRTGTAEIHKTQKAFYLAAGRYIDGWKNAQAFVSQGKEEKLREIKEYKQRIEAERIEAIRAQRWELLSQYTDFEPDNLGKMPDDVFNNLLAGTKAAYEARIEAERKAEEERQKEIERQQRISSNRNRLLAYSLFIPNFDSIDFENVDVDSVLESVQVTISDQESEQKRIREENERLQKEAEAERIRVQKEQEEIRLKHEDEQRKIREEAEAARLKAQKEADELRKKIEAQQRAEAEAKAAEAARLESEAAKGDSAKFADFISDLSALKNKYAFKSAKYKKAYEVASELIDRLIAHVNK